MREVAVTLSLDEIDALIEIMEEQIDDLDWVDDARDTPKSSKYKAQLESMRAIEARLQAARRVPAPLAVVA